MALFSVRLESPVDSQWREVTVDSPDADAAVERALELEQEYVGYTLDADPNADKAHIEKHYSVDEDGKVRGPDKRNRARLHMHLQKEPYKVARVEPVEFSSDQLVLAALSLQANPEAWERTLKALRDAGVPLGVVTGSLFGLTAQGMIDGSAPIVWSSATIKVALTTSTYTPNQDTHHFFSDVTNEVTGTGYTAGGATLASKTSTYDTASDQIRLDAADTSWASSTITARRAVVWNDTAGASTTDPIMGWLDFGADVSTTAGTFQITWDATGIIVYDVT